MGTKNNPGKFDCYANAAPDEPMFVLLARDPVSCFLVRAWALLRAGDIDAACGMMRAGGYKIRNGAKPLIHQGDAKYDEAIQCAEAMFAWQNEHNAIHEGRPIKPTEKTFLSGQGFTSEERERILAGTKPQESNGPFQPLPSMRTDMAEVWPNVFVGGWHAARDCGSEFDIVFNVADDAPKLTACIFFPMVDGPGNQPAMMRDAIEAVRIAVKERKKILVHCVSGRSRSVVVVAAAIRDIHGIPIAETIERIRPVRKLEPNQPHEALLALVPDTPSFPRSGDRRQSDRDPPVEGVTLMGGDRMASASTPREVYTDAGKEPMRLLNIGAGGTLPNRPWINVDYPHEHPEMDNYVRHDASKPLPFPDNWADGLIACHFIEHFECLQAVEILQEFYRVLKPGGVARIVVPDASYHRKVYPEDLADPIGNAMRLFGEPLAGRDRAKQKLEVGRKDKDDTFMSFALFWADHKQLFTEDSLWCELVQAGFEMLNIYVAGHQKTAVAGHSCSASVAMLDNRELFSLRMEAVK